MRGRDRRGRRRGDYLGKAQQGEGGYLSSGDLKYVMVSPTRLAPGEPGGWRWAERQGAAAHSPAARRTPRPLLPQRAPAQGSASRGSAAERGSGCGPWVPAAVLISGRTWDAGASPRGKRFVPCPEDLTVRRRIRK